MLTTQELYAQARERQFVPQEREPEQVNVLINDGAIAIKDTELLDSKNNTKKAVAVYVKNIEQFGDFKKWCNERNIPTYHTMCDEYLRPVAIILWDGMPIEAYNSHEVIRLDVNVEANGEDIMEIALRYYSI